MKIGDYIEENGNIYTVVDVRKENGLNIVVLNSDQAIEE